MRRWTLSVLLFGSILVLVLGLPRHTAFGEAACQCSVAGKTRGTATCRSDSSAMCVYGKTFSHYTCVPNPQTNDEEGLAKSEPLVRLKFENQPVDKVFKAVSVIAGYEVVREDPWAGNLTLSLDTGRAVPLSALLQVLSEASVSPVRLGNKVDISIVPDEIKALVGAQPLGIVSDPNVLKRHFRPSRDSLRFKSSSSPASPSLP